MKKDILYDNYITVRENGGRQLSLVWDRVFANLKSSLMRYVNKNDQQFTVRLTLEIVDDQETHN